MIVQNHKNYLTWEVGVAALVKEQVGELFVV